MLKKVGQICPTFETVEKPVIANHPAGWCGNLRSFLLRFRGFFFYLGDSHTTSPAGLCRGQPPQAALSPAQSAHWFGMTLTFLTR